MKIVRFRDVFGHFSSIRKVKDKDLIRVGLIRPIIRYKDGDGKFKSYQFDKNLKLSLNGSICLDRRMALALGEALTHYGETGEILQLQIEPNQSIDEFEESLNEI